MNRSRPLPPWSKKKPLQWSRCRLSPLRRTSNAATAHCRHIMQGIRPYAIAPLISSAMNFAPMAAPVLTHYRGHCLPRHALCAITNTYRLEYGAPRRITNRGLHFWLFNAASLLTPFTLRHHCRRWVSSLATGIMLRVLFDAFISLRLDDKSRHYYAAGILPQPACHDDTLSCHTLFIISLTATT